MSVRRIHVIGVSGSGKTTLARQAAAILGVGHLELDAVFWQENWTYRNLDDAHARRYCQDLWMRLFQAASCWSGEAVPGSTSSPFLKVAPART